MKRTIFIIIFSYFLLNSCAKQMPVRTSFATLQVYGAIKDYEEVVPNLRDDNQPLDYYRNAARLHYGGSPYGFHKFYIYKPSQPISFYYINDTFPKSSPVLQLNLDLEIDKIYTLYLAGPWNSLDTLLVKEENTPIFLHTDSLTAFRFVNLSNDAPISINLKGQEYGSMVNNLSYLGITEYIQLPILSNTEPYEFEIRDAVTHDLIAEYSDPDMLGYINGQSQWLQKTRVHVLTGTRGVADGHEMPQIRAFNSTY